jgi:hypothetical protein
MGRLQRALARCLVEIHGAAEHAGSAQLAHRRASAGDGLWLLALSICACVVFLGLLVGAPRASGADEVDANCKVCQQRGEACLTETDANGIRTFHGCCGGIICPGPFLGGTVSVCCNTGVCNVTTGHCVAQCPAGTSLCHDSTCTPDCSPPPDFRAGFLQVRHTLSGWAGSMWLKLLPGWSGVRRASGRVVHYALLSDRPDDRSPQEI